MVMNILNLLFIAWDALIRNKFRALLTMLGIIIGVASVIDMLAIGQGSKLSIQKQVSAMGSNLVMVMPGTQARGGVQLGNTSSKSLTLDDVNAIAENCPSIVAVSPEVRSNGQAIVGKENTPTSLYGVAPSYLKIKKISIKQGRIFTDQEVKASTKVCLLGETVVEALFGKNSNPVGSTIRFNRIPLKVIGVLKPRGRNTFGMDQDDLILAPYSTVQKRILAITHIQGISASAASEEKSNLAEKEIEKILKVRHKIKQGDDNDFDVRTQQELISTFSSISDMLTILLGAIAGISLIVGGIGIMNIMYVSVTERTKEIGLRMSLGAKRKDILFQFLSESILISVLGGIIGILIGFAVSELITSILNWPVAILPESVLLSFLVCSAIGTFFGWYPARRAAHLNPIEALRYE